MVSATRVQLTYGASTDTGLKRSHNEDRFYADRETGLFVVVDGVGGQTAGQVAAETVVEEMRRFISDTKADEDKTWPFGMEPELSAVGNRLRTAVLLANSSVFRRIDQDEKLKGMAATMSAALVSGSCVALSNVGDCRAYLLRNQELTQVTRDHSWVAEQVRSGVLDEAAARVHPLRNLVTRAINGANRLDVDVVELGFLDGNLLLLCSDGLHGPVSDDNIKSTLLASGTPTEQSKKLVELANANGGPDNITALIIRATP